MIVHGRLFAPEDLGPVLMRIEDGRIAAIESVDADVPTPPNALGRAAMTIAPGFLDIQVNGAFGQDLADPNADVGRVSAGLPAFGVTGYLACIVTAPLERYGPCLDRLAAATAAPEGAGARLLGVHIEGPFLNPRRRGTHTPEWLRDPDPELTEEWLDRAPIRLMTLAPELPGALDLIRRLVARDVTVAIGHTDATWSDAAAAAAAGARLGTHIFNAMRPIHHREPGAVGYLLASDLAVSIIADGLHLAPGMLQLVGRLKAPDELIVITDALAALGMPPGTFELAGVEIVSDGTSARRTDGTLSGSLVALDQAIRNLVAAGLPRESAVRAVTVNPARLLGLESSHGRVAVGRAADLVLLDEAWNVEATLIAGRVVHGRVAGQ